MECQEFVSWKGEGDKEERSKRKELRVFRVRISMEFIMK